MSGGDHQGGAGFPAHPTADECVRAGMYWFARSDFTAAQAWWERAIEIDPGHVRARECLRLLQKTSPTGFKSDASESFIGSQDLGRTNLDNPWHSPGASGPGAVSPPNFATAHQPSSDPARASHQPLVAESIPTGPDQPLFSTDDLDIRIPLSLPDQSASQSDLPRLNLSHTSESKPAPPSEAPPPATPVLDDDFMLEPITMPAFQIPGGPADRASSSDGRPESEAKPSTVPGRSISSSGRPLMPNPPPTPQDPEAPFAQFAVGPHSLLSPDPFDFVAEGERPMPSLADALAPVENEQSPWDDGPSSTSVVTVGDETGFDVVAEPTPLPEIDRERFFSRGDPQSPEEIVSFLQATGDMPTPEPNADSVRTASPDPLMNAVDFDEPVDFDEDEPSGEFMGPLDTDEMDEPTHGGGIELVQHLDALDQAKNRFSLHDFDGVLELLEALPPQSLNEEAKNLAAEARRNLLKMYESKIGDFNAFPKVLISAEEVIWLNLNHRAGFILSQIDGAVTFEDLVALSGMPRLDTLRILTDLIQKKVIGTS